ncbi:MAG: hypothetical protein U1D69_11530 [Polynucleobacter sp.]|nr:hypothetical protein [Polynucleobacter sp.]
MLAIPAQPYNDLYKALKSIGLRPVGVDFVSGRAQAGMHLPPDFQTIAMPGGFEALSGERAWADVKHVPEQRTRDILDISGRFTTYHRLLALRVRELSEAYRGCLLAQLTDIDGKYKEPKDGVLFSNGFQLHIEAALHAFLADAAAMRDVIAEAVWRLVLRESSTDVTSFSTLLKKTRNKENVHALVDDLRDIGAEGGWMKVLTDLRNSVTHIAPLANTNELHLSQVRIQPLRGGSIPIIHYPLTQADGTVRPRPEPIDFNDEMGLKARFRAYGDFVAQSGDALAYASECTERLVSTSNRVRKAAGLKHEMLTLTDADIIGPVRIHRS